MGTRTPTLLCPVETPLKTSLPSRASKMIVAVTDLDYERTNLILVNVRTTDAGSPSKFFDKLITVVVGNARGGSNRHGQHLPHRREFRRQHVHLRGDGVRGESV